MDETTFARILDERLERTLDERLENHPRKRDMEEAIAAAVAPLATKRELADAVAPLATKQELADAIAPLATKVELAALGDDLKHHFGVMFESLRDEIRVVADGVLHLNDKLDGVIADNERRFGKLETRVDRLDVRTTRLEEHTGLDSA